jgi:hypothetical protein
MPLDERAKPGGREPDVIAVVGEGSPVRLKEKEYGTPALTLVGGEPEMPGGIGVTSMVNVSVTSGETPFEAVTVAV